MNVTETVETLQKASQILAGVCDGAATLDGHGYNGCDSPFGKSLASKDRWSAKQALAAQKMLTKYRKQLSSYGMDITALPKLSAEDFVMETATTAPAKPRRLNEVRLNPKDDSFEFHFAYDFDQKEYVKAKLAARFHSAQKYWYTFGNAHTAKEVKAYAEHYGAEILPDAQARIDALLKPEADAAPAVAAISDTVLSKAEDADLTGVDLTGFMIEPFPFQKAGIAYGLRKKKVLIGDDMGLGKTIQALGILHAAKVTRFIVVCPAAVKLNWEREIRRAIPNLIVSVWDAKTGHDRCNVIVINYDNLAKRLNDLFKFNAGALIIDEFHYLKSAKAKRTESVKALADTGIEYVIGLSGTPIFSRPSELISPLNIVGRLGDFGGWFPFAKRYCKLHKKVIFVKGKFGAFRKEIWDASGADNLVELNDRLRASCMVRRRKVDVLKDLPSKQRAQVVFPITNRKDYKQAEDHVIEYIAATAAADQAFLNSIRLLAKDDQVEAIRRHQEEAVSSASRAEQLVQMELLKQLATTGKIEAVKSWIEDFLETGEKLLVFATHVDAQTDLLNHFHGQAAKIVAEDDIYKRQAEALRFRTDPECNLMIASLKAGGTGIDGLQDNCTNVAFLEMGWTPAEHMQAEDRLHRIGQHEQVMAYYFVAENTVEETIQEMLAKKQAVCDSVLDGAEEVKQGSVFNELVTVLRARAV